MSPQLSAEGEKINWINYKTGEKHIQFRLSADNKSATIGIAIIHPDATLREIYFEQFIRLKNIFTGFMEEEWHWQPVVYDEHGKLMSMISTTLSNVSVFRREDWPAIISFFKPRLIALDAFWSNVKYSFEMLRE